MMQTKNLRGECQHCGGVTEFPAAATGTTAACPHCGQTTELMLALPSETASPIRTKAIVFSVVALVILLGGLGGAVLALKRAQRISHRQPPGPVGATNQPPTKLVGPFAASGFRVSPVALEKGEGTSLVYATGTIVNLANRQRFGVRIELDLLDASSNKLSQATDYRSTLEPGAEWRFRALVVDKKAASARVATIKEDK
jgi:hypothetical protein